MKVDCQEPRLLLCCLFNEKHKSKFLHMCKLLELSFVGLIAVVKFKRKHSHFQKLKQSDCSLKKVKILTASYKKVLYRNTEVDNLNYQFFR